MKKRDAFSAIKELAGMTDYEFFEKYLADASTEELAEFCREFPGFLEDGKTDVDISGADTEKLLEEIKKKIGI